tara:strand:+ start:2427 stop:2585 length:159 start_codon:yes stop_codon:yes gene_type:complete
LSLLKFLRLISLKSKKKYFNSLKLDVIERKVTDGSKYGTSKEIAYNNNTYRN